MSVVASPRPAGLQLVLGACVEMLGVGVIVLPGLLADGEVRLVMPWAALGGVLIAIGTVIAMKAILDARRAGI